jgi:hypothetical protein
MPKTTSLDLRELAEPFNAWCAQRRISRSLALRQLVASAIGADLQISWLPPVELAPPSREWDGLGFSQEEPPYRFTLRLTQSQRDRLRMRAVAAGISCSRYILAAVTARDCDGGKIAGKDAVEALSRSNDLLAQAALRFVVWRNHGAAAGALSVGGDPNPVQELVEMLHEHLARAAAVVSTVERTRVGRTPTGRPRKGGNHARRERARRGPQALG